MSGIVAEEDYLIIRNTENPVPLILAFAGIGDAPIPFFEFYNFLNKNFDQHANFIFFRDRNKCWYQKGIHGMGSDVPSTVQCMKELICPIPYTKLITLGLSAGGFAAILFGSLIPAHSIIAFGPQTFLDQYHRTLYKDRSRAQHMCKLPPSGPYLDLNQLEIPELWYVLGTKDATDVLHKQHLQHRITYLIEGDGGHHMVRNMRADGSLVILVKKILDAPVESTIYTNPVDS